MNLRVLESVRVTAGHHALAGQDVAEQNVGEDVERRNVDAAGNCNAQPDRARELAVDVKQLNDRRPLCSQ